jgi:hypothetical protein
MCSAFVIHKAHAHRDLSLFITPTADILQY